jgi:hypothetical protein
MRKARAIVIGVSLTAITMPAMAQVVYVGRENITAVTRACTTPGGAVERVGDTADLVYRPIIPGVQTGPETLASFADSRSQIIEPAAPGGLLNGSGTFAANKIDAVAQLVPYSGDYTLTITRVATDIVTISGAYSNAWDTPGCNVSFQAVLGLRPQS